jgi:hypothetical protein
VVKLSDVIIVNLIERDVYAFDFEPLLVQLLKEHAALHKT